MLWRLGHGRQTTSAASAGRLSTAVPRSANTPEMTVQLSGAPASMPFTYSASKSGSRQVRSRSVQCAVKRGSTSGQPNNDRNTNSLKPNAAFLGRLSTCPPAFDLPYGGGNVQLYAEDGWSSGNRLLRTNCSVPLG
ncbi:hypothetical protein Vafri_16688 [Volvox africanus]|uniref:Uncharacterized protein n=1 Tax=Volvox africanus TaxID=51714 RepID=A0A8J4BJE2_9CHLO|nr:hypothetical protein Vafri_16688 [Volvox africanus]